MGYRVRIPGVGGKIEAKKAKLHAAIAAEFARLEEKKKPKTAGADPEEVRAYSGF